MASIISNELNDLIDPTVEYDRWGRMKYHPEYHENHGKSFTIEELYYLCKYWEVDDIKDLSFGMG